MWHCIVIISPRNERPRRLDQNNRQPTPNPPNPPHPQKQQPPNTRNLHPQNPVFDPSKSNWLKDQIAFTLPSILTSSECSSWITESESLGFIKATVLKQGNAVVNEDFRKSGRCIIDSSLLAEALWNRIREHIPSVIRNSSEPDCIYRPVGINERFRVLKYEPGDSFKRHRDFSFRRDDGSEVSMLTVQLYLNNCEEGGETLFWTDARQETVSVSCEVGQVLVFSQRLWHAGGEVMKGVKYVVRTEVMYRMETLDV